jgi:hypothetical protein
MREALKVTRAQVAPLVRGTFPNYQGRKFRVEAAEAVTLADLNWSGGTRSQYRACTLTGEPTGGADRYNAMAPWANPAEGQRLPVPAGFAVVEHTQFCGKDLGLRIYLNPVDMPKLLEAK